MCGIESMGLFQNGAEDCDNSCGHALCGRAGFSTMGRVEEGGCLSGLVRRKEQRHAGPSAADAETPAHPLSPPS